jgi:hypothetical protein
MGDNGTMTPPTDRGRRTRERTLDDDAEPSELATVTISSLQGGLLPAAATGNSAPLRTAVQHLLNELRPQQMGCSDA